MKKISMWAPLLHESENVVLKRVEQPWVQYLSEKLYGFNVNSPEFLSEEQKNEFFSTIIKEWNISKKYYVFEEKVNSEKEFREYATTVLKKAFGSEYDSDKANKIIKNIIDTVDGDYGKAVGILTSSLGD